MRRILLCLAIAGMAPATASAADRPAHEREYLRSYSELRHRHGVRAPGCNLLTDRYGNRCAGKATRREVHKSTATLKRMLYVPPAPAPVAPSPAPSGSTATPVAPAPATSGGGSYCGLFQFDQQTWQSVGGSGSPCGASQAEQWDRARRLQSQRGNQPWPVCGQGGASLEQIVQCESGGDPGAVG